MPLDMQVKPVKQPYRSGTTAPGIAEGTQRAMQLPDLEFENASDGYILVVEKKKFVAKEMNSSGLSQESMDKISAIEITGNGDKVLMDDGSYKSVTLITDII
jgi:pyruvate kinase